jgi:hypothetical protein
MTAKPEPAHDEYTRRHARLARDLSAIDRLEGRLANGRLALFGAAILIAWLALGPELIDVLWIGLPIVAFVVLMLYHERVRKSRQRTERLSRFYERGLARLESRWIGLGPSGEQFSDDHHPYASDLDLFGEGSLFQLMSTANTTTGEETLAHWFRNPATREEIKARQEAIIELREHLDLRESLAAFATEAREADRAHSLTSWATAPPVRFSGIERASASLLGIAGVVTLIGWFAGFGALPFLVSIILIFLFNYRVRARVAASIGQVDAHLRELELLTAVLRRIEQYRFRSEKIRRLSDGGERSAASVRLGRLTRLIDLLDAKRNQFFFPIAALILWTAHLAFSFARWRRENGSQLIEWLEAVGEFEALMSLAMYAYENPQDAFPEITDELVYEAVALSHPLLPAERAVPNDVHLGRDLQLLIVSGSNMSGKSTLLRSVGVNAVLAFAGAPVRARSLRLPLLSIGASIRINDSLQSGASRFYAEISRLKQIVELSEDGRPLLFLLDEILNGTNSHDRKIGADAVLRRLVDAGAIGLVTTHDLALARLAENLPDKAKNVHFEDHMEEGRMTFDYTIKEGVVQKSNALALMRAVGLEV